MELRPYLVYPKMVEQPTWGGKYIAEYKNWQLLPELQQKNIGQSYELYGGSYLSAEISDSTSSEFRPEQELNPKAFSITSLNPDDLTSLLGPAVYQTHKKMPLLIKFTQAKGNSFQLHKKPDVVDPAWLPKAESWYFFEDGYMTFGLKPGASVDEYKQVSTEIYQAMQALSKQVVAQTLSLDDAKHQAAEMIKQKNPWQFVNVYHVPKFTMVDLSVGGLHHSWEEDPQSPFGNIVYEVQQDAPDESSTLRSFDQGKIKDDGTIRPLTIDEYFRFLDTNPDHNDVEKAKQFPNGERILTTKNYFMDLFTVTSDKNYETNSSFAHIFVREGDVTITAGTGSVRVTKGHSCLIPHGASRFTIHTNLPESIVIRTGIE